jgi:hypothetical protein
MESELRSGSVFLEASLAFRIASSFVGINERYTENRLERLYHLCRAMGIDIDQRELRLVRLLALCDTLMQPFLTDDKRLVPDKSESASCVLADNLSRRRRKRGRTMRTSARFEL